MPQTKPTMLLADIFARAVSTLPFASLDESDVNVLAEKIEKGAMEDACAMLDSEILIHEMADNYLKAEVLASFRASYRKWAR